MTTTTSSASAQAAYAAINTAKTTTTSSTAATSTNASATLTSNYNTFLTLLTTQLQNQDPTAPMDSSTFTQQLVQYSQVEQQIDTNKNLTTLISQGKSSEAATAVSYIGKSVEVQGSQLSLSSGTATVGYVLPSTAASATVTITDSSGNVVKTISGGTATGSQTVTWDGTNSSGTQMSDGTYSFSVSALDSSGKALTTTNFAQGTVSSVVSDTSGIELEIGSLKTNVSNVISVT
ncbi:MAG TPA: flagellar hook capping FlgD N-terminal domain-containing protein [Stellaceae bacterium]|nr:flagellar hook capping FlgD N-terminal domain-containing protein [Stellaceae bacterium]